ncbi:MAG: hypothetical protein CVT64_08565 [Actinobacteria bacterium HGW-Actinobacteria-4]|nr:MAG: hypothetical protein CVT64_08565 [Actinobacteria bacterium HGW-Actinobacteria-4]
MNRLALPLSIVTLAMLVSGAADVPDGEGATWWATAFYWVVAAGALTYLVLSRRGDKKSCKREESVYLTSERKRLVREDLLARATVKRDDAANKLQVLTEQGADAEMLASAQADLAREEDQVSRRQQDLVQAQRIEDDAKAAFEQCQLAQSTESDSDHKR